MEFAVPAPKTRPQAPAFSDGPAAAEDSHPMRPPPAAATGESEAPAAPDLAGTGSIGSSGSGGRSGHGAPPAPSDLPTALVTFSPPDWAADVAPADATAASSAAASAAATAAALASDDGDGSSDGSGDGSSDGSAASVPWRLEVLRGGVPQGFVDLMPWARVVVGRQGGGCCQLVLEHPSISRAHAVLQHHRNGWASTNTTSET